jgi:hypothetical protein
MLQPPDVLLPQVANGGVRFVQHRAGNLVLVNVSLACIGPARQEACFAAPVANSASLYEALQAAPQGPSRIFISVAVPYLSLANSSDSLWQPITMREQQLVSFLGNPKSLTVLDFAGLEGILVNPGGPAIFARPGQVFFQDLTLVNLPYPRIKSWHGMLAALVHSVTVNRCEAPAEKGTTC